jgi:hypothetical protein
MATGSGKTLLLHVNLWQLRHYLQHAAHPDSLVRRQDRHRRRLTADDGQAAVLRVAEAAVHLALLEHAAN